MVVAGFLSQERAERGWTAGQYERWLVRSLGALLRKETRNDHQQTQE